MMYFIHSLIAIIFRPYCVHLQGDIIKRIQKYKCGCLCLSHSITKSCKVVTATQKTTFVLL